MALGAVAVKIDDPQVLKAIQQLEGACATLRRLAGFVPLNATPETTASREPKWWCDPCHIGFLSGADFRDHLETDHR